ncbi:MAG: hypothetical protein HQL80_03035 [Magnetococcales bacterium]|nr:hypothetical protein [Magnetococcales bacterium]
MAGLELVVTSGGVKMVLRVNSNGGVQMLVGGGINFHLLHRLVLFGTMKDCWVG